MTLWELVTSNSTLPVEPGNSLWDHLNNQRAGTNSDTPGTNLWEIVTNHSALPVQPGNNFWDHLSDQIDEEGRFVSIDYAEGDEAAASISATVGFELVSYEVDFAPETFAISIPLEDLLPGFLVEDEFQVASIESDFTTSILSIYDEESIIYHSAVAVEQYTSDLFLETEVVVSMVGSEFVISTIESYEAAISEEYTVSTLEDFTSSIITKSEFSPSFISAEEFTTQFIG